MEIQFYDIEQRRRITVPLTQVRKSVCRRTTRRGKVRIHYTLIARLNGTSLIKFVTRRDWMALDVPRLESLNGTPPELL